MRPTERLLALTLAAAVAGCTLQEVEPPAMTGPSELSPSVTMTATPDVLPEDGTSRSVITIIVRDASGQPMQNVQLRVSANGGQLSAGQISTGVDGRATVNFTAPLTLTPGFDPGTVVRVFATPIGTNFDNSVERSVAIRLVPPAVIQVPGAPVAAFQFGPQSPTAGQVVLFDASASFDPNGTIVTYEWDWGDGDVHGFGRFQDHDFPAAGTYFVTLTVTDDTNLKATITRAIVVTGS
jgi:hypothetical protein